jgi:hypothetical protein
VHLVTTRRQRASTARARGARLTIRRNEADDIESELRGQPVLLGSLY